MFLTRTLCSVMTEKPYPRRWPMHSDPIFGREQPSVDRFWKRRRVFLMTAHMKYRQRNCFRLAVRAFQKDLLYIHKENTSLVVKDNKDLMQLRLEAGFNELDFDGIFAREALTRAHVHLNDEMLANLAIWEPRTFRALAGIAAFKAMQPSESGGMNMQPCGPEMDVIMR